VSSHDSERFAPVRDAFVRNLATCQDIGASVAIFIDGEAVVDLWGGHVDATYTRPLEKHSIVQNFSSTKTVAALCALFLADRHEIDLDAPVARYWPEFSAEGKGGIAVRQVSFIDLDTRMSLGFVPNRWIGGEFEQYRSANIVRAAYRAIATAT
jgi:CubicO group peptidase (beta-lactamase class C family)